MLTFFIDGSKLKNVTRLKYLGSIDIVLSKTTPIFLEHETAGLYQIQNEVEARTVEGYALNRSKEVQFCLCLVSA